MKVPHPAPPQPKTASPKGFELGGQVAPRGEGGSPLLKDLGHQGSCRVSLAAFMVEMNPNPRPLEAKGGNAQQIYAQSGIPGFGDVR